MKSIMRSLLAIVAAATIIVNPIGVGQTAAQQQPRIACDQLLDRLAEIQERETQIHGAYLAAFDPGDPIRMRAVFDQVGTLLADTEALLNRMDECSRSPVPSLAD